MQKLKVLRGFTEIKHLWELTNEHSGYIAGGYVRYMCSPTQEPATANDIDIFFTKEEDFYAMDAALTVIGYENRYENPVAITYNNPKGWYGPTVQLVKPASFFVNEGSKLIDIVEKFDFTVARIGLLSESMALADDRFVEDETNKNLFIKYVNSPFTVINRVRRYGAKGYFMRPQETLKLLEKWDSFSADYKQSVINFLSTHDLSEEDRDNGYMLLKMGENADD